MIRKILNLLYLSSGVLAATCIIMIVIIVFLQVLFVFIDKLSLLILDDLILDLNIPSYSDFTGFLFAAASFLSLAYTLKNNGHIKVSIVINWLNERQQKFFEIASLFIAAIITCYASFYMMELIIETIEFEDKTTGIISIPLWIPQTPLLVGLIILVIALLDNLSLTIYRLKSLN